MRDLFLFAVAACAAAQAQTGDALYRQLRDADVTESAVVENVTLQRDSGVFTLRTGTVSFGPPILGRVTMAVFNGEGEFTLNPANDVEKRYLKSLTGADQAREAFQQAVFFFTDDAYKTLRGNGRAGSVDPRAHGALVQLRSRLRHRTDTPRSMVDELVNGEDNVEAEILAGLYNPNRPSMFSAYIDGRKHSDLRFHIRPFGIFEGLPSSEEVALVNVDPGANDEGVWYMGHLISEPSGHGAAEDKRVAIARRYRIETTLADNDHLAGNCELQVETAAPGERVIRFGLEPTLRVSGVKVDNQSAGFIQEDRKADPVLYVILPAPLDAGRSYQISLVYEGDKVLRKEGGGNFAVGARDRWYPTVNSLRDRAAYDLTFRYPKKYTLVAVGRQVDESKEGNMTVAHWTSTAPLAVAGFNYGEFKKKQVQDSTIPYIIEGYATAQPPDYLHGAGDEMMSTDIGHSHAGSAAVGTMTPSGLLDNAMAQAQTALRVFNKYFGPLPYGRIAITQQPQFNFGQSWPTLVYLPMAAFLDGTQRWQLFNGISRDLTAFVDEVAPHEVSHQWWGHLVGWDSYRDQWLSEGFADFSAGLYTQLTSQNPSEYTSYLERARDLLLDKNSYGIRANDAGPLCLGLRLDTAKTGAYDRVVYSKGGYVLHMLRWMMYDPQNGDDLFIKMMHDFTETNANRNATAMTLQATVEKYMKPNMDLDHNRKMDWFFREWVYGTDVPRYRFDYTVTPADGGKFTLKASLTQSEVSDTFKMLVPIYLDYDGRVVRMGQAAITGNTTVSDITVTLPRKPNRVLINAHLDVLSPK